LHWKEILLLAGRDLLDHGVPPTDGAWVRHIQDACIAAGIREPSDMSLRPIVRRWRRMMRDPEWRRKPEEEFL
jgi:hypothetical protein